MMNTLLVALISLDGGLALLDDNANMVDTGERQYHRDNEGDAFLQTLCTFHQPQTIKTETIQVS